MKPSLSLRTKIVALVAGALTVSLASYVFLGTNIIVDDKVSYIYDYSLSKIGSVSESLETRIKTIAATSRLIAQTKNPELMLEQHGEALGITGLILLKERQQTDTFELITSAGPSSEAAHLALAQLGWTPALLRKTELQVGSAYQQNLPVGGYDSGTKFFYVALVDPRASGLGQKGQFEVHLIDQLGQPIAATAKDKKSDSSALVGTQEIARLGQDLFKRGFRSGVQDWKDEAGKEFIIGYSQLASRQLMAISVIPREIAFQAATDLTRRSLVLGASILFLAIGLGIFFVKGVIRRLRQMWLATQKVAQGDFTFRVDIQSKRGDEITDLANSFNAMSDKIDELMVETAQKARLEKEIETAQLIQTRFYPKNPLQHPNIDLAGSFISATECAGDWWQYSLIGSKLIAIIADVTGHGVSSALVTAAAHGAYALYIHELKQSGNAPDDLAGLVYSLNQAVHAAGGEAATMTLFASIIDLVTGTMEFVNASHRPVYHFREQFKALLGEPCSALGYPKQPSEIIVSKVDLEPGDRIFWYTDGLVECTDSKGQILSRRRLFKLLDEVSNGKPASEACREILSRFIGDQAGEHRDDDITLMIGMIPATAVFHRRTLEPAA